MKNWKNRLNGGNVEVKTEQKDPYAHLNDEQLTLEIKNGQMALGEQTLNQKVAEAQILQISQVIFNMVQERAKRRSESKPTLVPEVPEDIPTATE